MSETSLQKDAINKVDSSKRPSILQVSRPFFTSSELSYVHSFTIPEQKKLTFNQRKHQIYQYVFQIVRALKLPLRVLGTTMNYYQRWYLFNKFEEMNDATDLENDTYTIALTCLFLASKNEDCIKKLKDIQAVSNRQRNDKSLMQQQYLDLQRKAIMNIEFKLLQVIKFDFINGSSIQSTDQLVVQFCKKLEVDYKTTMYSWLISFDLMSTPLCLIIPPHCIALAIIIVTLNLKPKEIRLKYTQDDASNSSPKLNEILETIDCYEGFRCPETLVNEGIIYILDYYVHQMNFSILNEFMPSIDLETGKEQIFKFMDLKSRFNDLKILDQKSCSTEKLLKQDEYLSCWDYSIGLKGSSRFISSNKRRRFDSEFEKLKRSN
ncbi:uncharacterized protein PRCAT00005526001 [Priceomyces carsonii]|uniref:uncharacterized protein n=1 Tax=Priceomyces carsonii TaxID=28549 RepID=UPI002ED82AE4|nr:unnamed protein product [Priceomyces carsonii]